MIEAGPFFVMAKKNCHHALQRSSVFIKKQLPCASTNCHLCACGCVCVCIEDLCVRVRARVRVRVCVSVRACVCVCVCVCVVSHFIHNAFTLAQSETDLYICPSW